MKFHRTVLVALTLVSGVGTALGAVGRTEGAASVTPNGVASYAIPIWAPSGAGGLGPHISIQYSHQADNGVLGVGFDISGLPMISRCNKTRAQDAAPAPPQLDPLDAYCLDGVRLRLVSGVYGNEGAIFETEIKTFSKITPKEPVLGGPTWFEVRTNDGLIYEYGHSQNSRLLTPAAQIAKAWALSAVRDRNGNTMAIEWTNDANSGSFRPDSITWTTNANSGLTQAPYRMQFVYETTDRPDKLTFYSLGSQNALSNRLIRIEISNFANGQYVVARQYRINYVLSPTSGRSRVSQIQECGASASDCLSPTVFDYQAGGAGWSNTEQSVGVGSGSGIDLNGDARDDLVYDDAGGLSLFYRPALPTGGFGTEQTINVSPPGQIEDWQSVNIDGDSFNDLVVYRHLSTPMGVESWSAQIVRNTGSGFVSYASLGTGGMPSLLGDFDGDGRDDDLSLYAYVGDDPVNALDPTGLRDVDVLIWRAEGTSVGHVMITEHNSRQVILSQFPANGMPWGQNQTRGYEATFTAEGRNPSSIWRVFVPDDRAFDKSAARERSLKLWSWSPSKDSTQCSVAASRALQAGGVDLSSIVNGTLMPGFFDNNLELSKTNRGNDIQRLIFDAGSRKGYDSIKINSNGTVTGSYTETGSRIKREVTCTSPGVCKSN